MEKKKEKFGKIVSKVVTCKEGFRIDINHELLVDDMDLAVLYKCFKLACEHLEDYYFNVYLKDSSEHED